MVVGGGAMEERLRTFFRGRPEVRTAYLFGSVARGEEGPTSDVDVAVVFDPGRVPDESTRWRKRLELTADLVDALDRNDVDVVDLEAASPLVAHRVVRDGIVVKDSAAERRIEREERIFHRYVDTKPLRRDQWDTARRRLGGEE